MSDANANPSITAEEQLNSTNNSTAATATAEAEAAAAAEAQKPKEEAEAAAKKKAEEEEAATAAAAAAKAEEERLANNAAALSALEKECDDGADAIMTEEEEAFGEATTEAEEGKQSAGAAEADRHAAEAEALAALVKEAEEAIASTTAEEAEERSVNLGDEQKAAERAERAALAELEALIKAAAIEFSLGGDIAADAAAVDALAAQSLKEEREVRHVEAASQRIVAALARIVGSTTQKAASAATSTGESSAAEEGEETEETKEAEEEEKSESEEKDAITEEQQQPNLRDQSATLTKEVARMREVITSVVHYDTTKKGPVVTTATASTTRTPARIANKRMAALEELAATNKHTEELWVAFNEDEYNQFSEEDATAWAADDLVGKGPAFATYPYTEAERASTSTGPYAARVANYTEQTESYIARLKDAEERIEAAKAATAEAAKEATTKIDAAFEAELKSIQLQGKRLKQVEEEQLYHVKRGTFVKEKSGIDHKAMAREKEGKIHNELCADAYEKEKRKGILENEIFALKKDIEAHNKESGKRQDEVKENIAILDGKLAETEQDREMLEHERADLTELKKDLTETIQRVRAIRK